MTSSLVFCVGPLTVLGSINDGLGNGADQLFLKSALDGFAAIAFAASLGWGVGASVLALLVVQGSLTALGAVLGDVMPAAQVAALTATGGLMLVGVALRLLRHQAGPGRRPAARPAGRPAADDPRRGAALSAVRRAGSDSFGNCCLKRRPPPRVGPSVTCGGG